MCVIIIKPRGKQMPKSVAKSSARINPDGLGIMWLDTFKVTYHKSSEYSTLYTERPFIAHFRYATIGSVSPENTHPFRCGSNKNEWLMMNGTIQELGDSVMSDSRVLANKLGDIPRHNWQKKLEKYPCRFVTINTRNRSYQMYNKHLWTLHDGIWYSKSNVLETNYIAVYGTLKKGYSNYYSYLTGSGYLGSGNTAEKYPLIVSGLPYLINKAGVGHNVEVDVFKVCDETLDRLDLLEGHPKWYKRERIDIQLKNRVVKCWVYFNGEDVPKGSILYKKYEPKYTTTKHTTAKSKPHYRDIKFPWEKESDYSYATADVSLKTQNEDEPCAICIHCYNDLRYDGFNNYHCNSCLSWFGASEIINY